ncbi:DinB family protein [Mucilaginibacter panaciglaebae]|uniref:DinB family protein n=1 Tax=Mucilaginibacter panaciglaebae TaxID=502331 RepID=UPI0031EC9364
MNISAEHKAIDQTLDTYRDLLDTLTDEQFAASPKAGGWSIAEIYSHILQATLVASIAVERCINGTCETTRKGLSLMGRFVLFFRRFPFRVATPIVEASKMTVTKISKEDARNLIIKCRRRIDAITPHIADESGIHKIKHSRLGMLNGKQWFKFTLIHLKHHLKQIDRIKNKFSD